MTDITKQIKEKLVEIEKKENIRILYACESGSRAWGGATYLENPMEKKISNWNELNNLFLKLLNK